MAYDLTRLQTVGSTVLMLKPGERALIVTPEVEYEVVAKEPEKGLRGNKPETLIIDEIGGLSR